MTKKQKYIGAFLDGYFSDKKLSEYNFDYLRLLEEATKKAKNEKHLIELNHYTNFQPLWAIDNLKKSNKIT